MTSTEPHPHNARRRRRHSASTLDERALLEAARAGSCGALAVLYQHYRPYAQAVARRSLGGEASLADDVVDVAFVRVFQALGNGSGPDDTLRRYLATAVRREAWRTQHRQRRQIELADRIGV
ncbi:MAG: hypothetical protein KC438_16320, partial [Thermomicrobiales bacterium]|nr:hypothetical protein [Thermomicrobiales bacterium]